MRAELVLLGNRFDMAQRSRRRMLVILIYAALIGLMVGLWFLDHWRSTGSYLFWAALLACRLALGGYYRGGLLKPFNNKVRRLSEAPPPLLLLKLHIYPTLHAADRGSYINDERELNQRDHAHYLAYQGIGVALSLLWLLSSMRIVKSSLVAWIPMCPDQMFYALTLLAVMLFLTLPQAILLWTEPDMETET
jgi:hypothetical protein